MSAETPDTPSKPDSRLSAVSTWFCRQAVVLLDMQHDARIDRSAARGHHQPIQRRKAHRGVDTATAAHRRVGAAASQMADHKSYSRPPDEPSISAARRLQ